VATQRVDVAVAVHYKEWGLAKNTAKLLPLVLDGCSAVVHPVHTLPTCGPVLLLFPGEDSQPAGAYREWVAAQHERVTLLVVDGTWNQARTMARQMAGVPRVHISEPARESLVLHRKQPKLGHVSTLEAVALALRALGEEHAEAPLLAALRLACDAHDEVEAGTNSMEMVQKKRAKRERHREDLRTGRRGR